MALLNPNSKKFKNGMAKLYGWGASVVILGAMFKLMHWPGAGGMLVVGLSIEAVIFFFSAFEKPHEEPDWSLVYPELGFMKDPEDKSSSANTANTILKQKCIALRHNGEAYFGRVYRLCLLMQKHQDLNDQTIVF